MVAPVRVERPGEICNLPEDVWFIRVRRVLGARLCWDHRLALELRW